MTTPNTPPENANESERLQDLLKGAATSDGAVPPSGRRPRYLPPIEDDSKKPRFSINIPLPSSGSNTYGQSDEVQDSLFAFEGRMGRLSYQAGIMLLGVFAMLGLFIGSKILGMFFSAIIVIIALLVFYIMLTKRRLHDLNLTGWLMLLPMGATLAAASMQMVGISFAPTIAAAISFVFTFGLILAPGTAGDNNYGPVRYTSTAEKIIGWVCLVLVAIGYIGGYSQRHSKTYAPAQTSASATSSDISAAITSKMTPEQKAQFEANMQAMTPEQRAQFLETMEKIRAMQQK